MDHVQAVIEIVTKASRDDALEERPGRGRDDAHIDDSRRTLGEVERTGYQKRAADRFAATADRETGNVSAFPA